MVAINYACAILGVLWTGCVLQLWYLPHHVPYTSDHVLNRADTDTGGQRRHSRLLK